MTHSIFQFYIANCIIISAIVSLFLRLTHSHILDNNVQKQVKHAPNNVYGFTKKRLIGLTPTGILFGYTRSVPERLRQRGVNELAQDSKRHRWDSNPGPLDLETCPLTHSATAPHLNGTFRPGLQLCNYQQSSKHHEWHNNLK